MSKSFSLSQLGWRPCFSQQLTLEELESGSPARVTSVHRGAVVVRDESGEHSVTLSGALSSNMASTVTVGDWVMVSNSAPRISRVLQRFSLISRLGAGTRQDVQPIAANLDTLFIVTSCNDDFNPSRLERYLAVALEAKVEPVIVLTKADLCSDVDRFSDEASRVGSRHSVLALNATTDEAARRLAPWLDSGQSVAFVGSSGVGKSTLVNSLTGVAVMATAGIREDDAKGRHTTTSRQLLPMPSGAWLMDTPGMRELRIGAVEAGISAVFTDIETLARSCRFNDCNHQGDEGCALWAAVASGHLEKRRVKSYLKLLREAANAALTLHERHARDRRFGKLRNQANEKLKRRRELK